MKYGVNSVNTDLTPVTIGSNCAVHHVIIVHTSG